MRGRRLLAVPVGVAAVAVLGVTAGRAPLARPGPAVAARTPAASIAIRPDVSRPTDRVLKTPPTTTRCRAQLKFACYRPGQIQQAYGFNKISFGATKGDGTDQTIADR